MRCSRWPVSVAIQTGDSIEVPFKRGETGWVSVGSCKSKSWVLVGVVVTFPSQQSRGRADGDSPAAHRPVAPGLQTAQHLCLFVVTRVFHSCFTLGKNTTFRGGGCVIVFVFSKPVVSTVLIHLPVTHLAVSAELQDPYCFVLDWAWQQ